MRKRSPSRSRTPSTPSDGTRAAASSIASGRPSRRRQMSTTPATLYASSTKRGSSAWTRSTNSWTAPKRSAAAESIASASPGTASGPSRNSCSPGTFSGSWLVTSNRTCGVRVNTACASRLDASSRCSQLSSTSSRCCGCNATINSSRRALPPRNCSPSVCPTLPGRNSGSASGASSTSHAPSGYRSTSKCAAACARRLLPMPPAPTTVTSRFDSASRCSISRSSSRPHSGSGSAGRLVRGRAPGAIVVAARPGTGFIAGSPSMLAVKR